VTWSLFRLGFLPNVNCGTSLFCYKNISVGRVNCCWVLDSIVILGFGPRWDSRPNFLSHWSQIPLQKPPLFQLLFPISDITENIQRCDEMHSVLLPICTAATAVRAMCKCCDRVLGSDSTPLSESFFNCTIEISFINLSVIPCVKFSPLYVYTVILKEKETISRGKNWYLCLSVCMGVYEDSHLGRKPSGSR
jgi:hypothetical protein